MGRGAPTLQLAEYVTYVRVRACCLRAVPFVRYRIVAARNDRIDHRNELRKEAGKRAVTNIDAVTLLTTALCMLAHIE